eukprot:GCRY01001186.1.p1 GENE.GCRY01001186.1~~GCRY01001186.1.p1  ORF type:complete len:352 (+),score=34.53 GCRY01001186.1:272-1327(+)
MERYTADCFVELILNLSAKSDIPSALKELENVWRSEGFGEDAGTFFTKLPLIEAYEEYCRDTGFNCRKFVPPSPREIIHILNYSQLLESNKSASLLCFDGDGTLYDEGGNVEFNSAIENLLFEKMQRGYTIALVTAAGYPESSHYELRLRGLLKRLQDYENQHPESALSSRLFVMGGECNYFFTCCQGHFVPFEGEWRSPEMLSWSEEEMKAILDLAASSLLAHSKTLRLEDCQIVRKPKAAGLIRKKHFGLLDERFEELCKRVKMDLAEHPFKTPFCVFNGGENVFVDIGNKGYGIRVLQKLLHLTSDKIVHFGDQFTSSGNDFAARMHSPTIWVANWKETAFLLEKFLN